MSPPNALRLAGRLLALAFVFLAAAACGSSTSPMSSAGVAGQSAHTGAGERHAVLAFSGTYRVKSVVMAATGAYAVSVGAVHFYTWQAAPACSGQSCIVRVASSTGSHAIFAYSNGEFRGIGRGSATCFDRKRHTYRHLRPNHSARHSDARNDLIANRCRAPDFVGNVRCRHRHLQLHPHAVGKRSSRHWRHSLMRHCRAVT